MYFGVGLAEEKSCKNQIDMEWNMYERNDYARFKITSSCEHPIYMKYISVKTDDLKEIKRKNLDKDYIRPYGVATYDLYIGDLNQAIVAKGSYSYSLSAPKKSSSSSSSRKKSSSGFSWWPAIIAAVVIAVIGVLAAEGRKIKDKPPINKPIINKTKKKMSTDNGNIFGFWTGHEGLAKTFWLYFVGGNAVGNLLTLLAESEGSGLVMFVFIIVIIWNVLAIMGVFKSADIYKSEMIKAGQSYGYATAAKIAVVVLILSAIGNAL